jgi:acyl carrier protein
VVVVREDTPEDKRLVAYVVAPLDTSTNELRSFLTQKLPEFMVPSAFVLMDSLPLTANGKVGRRALPEPASSRPELDETFLLPRIPTEELLATIWAEVLKLDKVGIHDNFFDLGGHSLLATRLISKIREVFRIELPLRALFDKPTVAGLSNHIVSIRWARDENKPTSKEGVDQTEEIIL